MFATPAVAGGAVIVASCSGTVFALDVATGAVRWRYGTGRDGPPANFHANPVLAEDLVVLGGDKEPTARVYAFDLASGAVRWSKAFDGGVPVDILRRGPAILAYTRRGDAVALDLATGNRVWGFSGGPRQQARPTSAPCLAGEKFVFAARPRDLFALDPATGGVFWHVPLPAEPTTSVVPVDGALIVGTGEGRLCRVDFETGALIGALGVGGRPFGTPVAAGACIVVPVAEDSIVCADRLLTAVRWRVTAPGGWSSPRPLVRGDEVVAGTRGGDVVALGLDGREVWRIHLKGEVRGLGGFHDLVFVGTRNGMVYALRVGRRGTG